MCIFGKFLYYNKSNYKNKYGYTLKDPVFIVGCGHSGTSILLSILSNSEIFYTIKSESYIFHKNKLNLAKELRLWVHNAYNKRKTSILEKTPSHCLKINDILKTFHDPKIIAIVRDGRDVSLSIKKRSGNFKSGLHRWVTENNILKKSLPHKNVLLLKYEEFVANPVETIKTIGSFTKLNISTDIINNKNYSHKQFYNGSIKHSFHEYRRNLQINQEIKDYSGQWKTGLSSSEKLIFENNHDARDLMIFLDTLNNDQKNNS